MNNENKFIPGLRVFPKHQNAPDFVMCDVSLEREVLINWLSQQQEKYIKVQMKVSRDGKPYAELNTYKPQQGYQAPPVQNVAPQATPQLAVNDFSQNINEMNNQEDIPF